MGESLTDGKDCHHQWVEAIIPFANPPLGLNVDEMAKYREQMKPHNLKAEIHFR